MSLPARHPTMGLPLPKRSSFSDCSAFPGASSCQPDRPKSESERDTQDLQSEIKQLQWSTLGRKLHRPGELYRGRLAHPLPPAVTSKTRCSRQSAHPTKNASPGSSDSEASLEEPRQASLTTFGLGCRAKVSGATGPSFSGASQRSASSAHTEDTLKDTVK